MTDAEYDAFARELTILCRKYHVGFAVDHEDEGDDGDVALEPGFSDVNRYVVAHDKIAGREVKLLICVIDNENENEPEDDDA